MGRSVDDLVAAIAVEQHGLITRRQALDLGLSRHGIQSRRRSGRWKTVEVGVYQLRGSPVTWHSRLLARCLAFGGVASHRSAAVLNHVDGFWPDIIELSIPNGRHVTREGVTFHESTDLHLFEPIVLAGIPTTPPTRLAVDLGAVIPFKRFDEAIDDLIRRKDVTWDDLLDVRFSHSRKGRDGVGILGALLKERWGEDVGASVLERAFLRELRRRGLPEPVAQLVIRDHDGFIARVDFAWPDRRVVVELDGRRYHGELVFEQDRVKRDRLVTAGWAVHEITWRMLFDDPGLVFRRLERLLERRAGHGE